MILKVFALYDKAVNAYLQPFYCRSLGEAIRSFTELSNDKSTNVARHPTDFDLMYLGEYDDSAGIFATASPARIIGATEVLKEDNVLPPGRDLPQRLAS